jgi:hypothetical protein
MADICLELKGQSLHNIVPDHIPNLHHTKIFEHKHVWYYTIALPSIRCRLNKILRDVKHISKPNSIWILDSRYFYGSRKDAISAARRKAWCYVPSTALTFIVLLLSSSAAQLMFHKWSRWNV